MSDADGRIGEPVAPMPAASLQHPVVTFENTNAGTRCIAANFTAFVAQAMCDAMLDKDVSRIDDDCQAIWNRAVVFSQVDTPTCARCIIAFRKRFGDR